MKRDKQFYIAIWKSQMDAQPSKVEAMTEEAWYRSFVGLAFRLFFAHEMSYDQLRREIE